MRALTWKPEALARKKSGFPRSRFGLPWATNLAFGLLMVAFSIAESDDPATLHEQPITPAEREHWAWRPLKRPQLPDANSDCSNPIDRFILARLNREGLLPLPPADRRTLLRRITFDLTGLPPRPGEAAAFLADHSPGAYERVIDRLLASPA